MSYVNGQILTETEITETIETPLPSKNQIGDRVLLYLGEGSSVDAVLIGVTIRKYHSIYYDLAVLISGTNLYSVIKDVRGYVYNYDEIPDESGGLIPVDDMISKLPPILKLIT